MANDHKNSEAIAKLSPEQFRVIQESATERSGTGAYLRNKDAGIYVDIVSTEQTIPKEVIVVTDQAAGMAEMKLMDRPEPQAAINDVVEILASGFVRTELAWPSTWIDRRDHDRTPSRRWCGCEPGSILFPGAAKVPRRALVDGSAMELDETHDMIAHP